ncbi:MAG: hypothetical protein ERJ67_02795 [Aphanocapsa feldmannii 277cV]|uniref:Uncharacterized protein n=1 Tax=Aphanocapsa feldmannii 277cV TaxID=2507553 RepID=A0A524RPZ9_9CHRO|nr:MAG: hypothetical protein ERJ67_02795 [Aphanocapsa feldmannii 277cV]
MVNAFVLGRHPGPGDSASLLETATLISVAGVVEFDSGTSRVIVMNSYGWPQLDDLVKLTKDLTKEELYANVQDLLDRGVLKKRGRLATLEPRPIAMRLAERKWKRWTKDKWDQILGGNTHPSLKIYAARQLTLLNTTDPARNIVEYVCRDDGPFAEIQGIIKEGHPEVMSAFSEVDVTVVVDLLERLIDQIDLHQIDLQKIGGNLRRQFVITIEKISFCPDTFKPGANLLLRLAVAENEACGNNATEQFKALFPIILGNTAANGDSRLDVLDSASETNDVAQRILVVKALTQGAQTNDFFRIGNAGAHGTRPSLESWQPNTKDEAKRYIEGCVERLAKFAVRHDEPAAIAREFLGLYLRSLILNGFIDVVEKVYQKLVDQVEYWPEGLQSLGTIIRWDTKELNPPQLVDRVKKLIASFKPKNIETRLRMLVTEMSWDYPDDEELEPETKRQRQTEAVRQLADELVKRPKDLAKYIPELSRKPVKDTRMRQRMTGYFGYAIAELAESPSEWYEPIVQALLATPQAERDYGLLTGYVTVLAKADPDVEQRLKQEIATTPSLAPAFPEICLWLEIKPSDVAIAVNALKSDLIKPVDLHKWNMGGQLAKLPVHDVAPLLDALLDRDAQSCHVALDLMDMYFYPGKDRLEGLHPQIQLALKSITKWRLHGKSIEAYLEFHKMLVCLLKKGRNDDDAKTIALELSKALVNSDLFSNWCDPNSSLRKVISALLSEFPEIAWTIVGEAILSDPIKARKLKFILGNELSASYRQKPVILSLPKETLFAWCYANPEKAPIFAAEVLPFLTSYDREKLDSELHPVMGQLIDQFGHLNKFQYLKNFWTAISKNIFNFSGWGSPTTYYKLYQRPLDALQKHEKPEVRTWSRKLLKELKSHIEAARDDEEDLENLTSSV